MKYSRQTEDTNRPSTLRLIDDQIIADFPYDDKLVAEIKAIDGAKWDKVSKVWRIPAVNMAIIRSFGMKYDFKITDEILAFDIPEHKNPGGGVTLEGNYLFLSFKYDPVMVRSVKQIEGITWDPKTKAWRAPLSASQTVIRWAETFKQNIPQDVRDRAERTSQELSVLKSASRATDADVEIKSLNGTLLPYQRAGVAYATNSRRAFIADEMGLGKTVQAMATLEYAHQQYIAGEGSPSYPAIVICPPNLSLNWKKEYNKFFPNLIVEACLNRKQIPMYGTYDVLIIGYSNINFWEKELLEHNSYIFDESHYCKSMDTQRTRAAKKMVKSAPKNAIVLCLTGTPVTNRPAEYAPQLELIGQLDKFGGLWGFYRRYCGAHKDKWGQWHLDGHSNLEELNEKLRSTCYIRRTKDQVMTDLPPVVHDSLLVDGETSIMKEYAKAKEDIVAYLVERARTIAEELNLPVGASQISAKMRAEAGEHLARISVLRKIAAKAKMPVVHEWIQERINDGKKVVVAAHHREIVDEIARKYGGLKIQGGMDINAVEDAKHKFQTLSCAEAPVIVLSIQAAKTGHTLTAAQNVLFVELPWTPADVDQTYSRCHRIGQKGSVTATYMMTSGTIDEDIYSLIEKKRAILDVAVEGELVFDDVNAVNILFNLMNQSI